PAWHELEATLWCVPGEVYALPPMERVHLDATPTCGYHAIDDDGLMQLGNSKDHRPDLPQIKLMAAAAEPAGLFLAGDVHPGHAADAPLYLPLYRRGAPPPAARHAPGAPRGHAEGRGAAA